MTIVMFASDNVRLAGAMRFLLAAGLLVTAAFLTQQSSVTAASTTVAVGDFYYCDETFENGVCETTISAGDTVVWDFTGAIEPHTTTECGGDCDNPTDTPLWDSGLVVGAETFELTFDEPGVFIYYCQVHPILQRGIIRVLDADTTPTVTPTVPPSGTVGDANCNGAVDSIDAALVLQFTAGLLGSLSCQENADTNANGTIDSIDAALILQFTAGLLPTLPP